MTCNSAEALQSGKGNAAEIDRIDEKRDFVITGAFDGIHSKTTEEMIK